MAKKRRPARGSRTSPSGGLKPPHTIGFLLRRAYLSLHRRFQAELAGLGLTPEQHGVLFVVVHDAGLSQREIAERLCSDANTVAALLQRMEAQGWLARSPDPLDGRIQRVWITDKGRATWQKSFAVSSRLHHVAVEGFAPAERAELLELLTRLYENVSPPPAGG